MTKIYGVIFPKKSCTAMNNISCFAQFCTKGICVKNILILHHDSILHIFYSKCLEMQ